MSRQPEKIEFVLRSSIFDRSRSLVLDPAYIEFDDNDRTSSVPTRFPREEIEGVRYYFDPISLHYIKLFQNGQPFEILGVSIDPEGVLFDYKAGRVSWDFLGTKRYQTYYTLFSEANPTEYKAFEYINHWNAGVLQSVVEGILKIKFPKRK